MTKSRISLRESQPGSSGSPGSGDSEDDSSDTKSPKKIPARGRTVEHSCAEAADVMDTKS